MKELIAYFPRANQNYVNGVIKNLDIGNTQIAAEILQKQTGADIFKIDPVVSYSHDYSECIEEAKADQRRDARPELKAYPDSLDEYDTIYLGYPNYWGTMPMAVFTFLEKYDFSGKTIKPFCTHEGSGMGSSEIDLKRICPTAKIEKGLAIRGGSADKSASALEKWNKK